jgi:DNA-binding winged helix-turn-helix (wHTH) protein
MLQTDGDNPGRGLIFGRFVLDPEHGRLLSSGREIPLRPTSYAILTALARRAGEAISQRELLESVWPGLVVTEDTLERSIAELRRALGDGDARFIVTLPGAGYRLDPTAAPPERRRAPGVHALRWRWVYGLLAPLVLAIAFAVIWYVTADEREAPSPQKETPGAPAADP